MESLFSKKVFLRSMGVHSATSPHIITSPPIHFFLLSHNLFMRDQILEKGWFQLRHHLINLFISFVLFIFIGKKSQYITLKSNFFKPHLTPKVCTCLIVHGVKCVWYYVTFIFALFLIIISIVISLISLDNCFYFQLEEKCVNRQKSKHSVHSFWPIHRLNDQVAS